VTFTFTVLGFMYEYNYLVGRDIVQPGRDTLMVQRRRLHRSAGWM